MVRLDIYSDPICPWCYIGKTHLDRALEALTENPFEINWHPYQLNPEMPQIGMDRKEYLEKKFGSSKGIIAAYGTIFEHTKKFNIDSNFEYVFALQLILDV